MAIGALLTDGLGSFGSTSLLLTFGLNPGVAAAAGPVSDRHIMRSIKEALEATGQFDAVLRGVITDAAGKPADYKAIAVIWMDNFEEPTFADDEDATQSQHSIRFRITIEVREDDPELREDELDRLRCVVANAVNYQSFNDVTITGLTLVRSGTYGKPDHPTQSLDLRVETAYFVDAPDLHDEEFD